LAAPATSNADFVCGIIAVSVLLVDVPASKSYVSMKQSGTAAQLTIVVDHCTKTLFSIL
jgi:hypothetical protein